MDWVNEIKTDGHGVNDAMRQHWNTAVAREMNLPIYYQSVAVLLIQWANWLDPNIQREEETTELEKVFRERFGFTTQRVILDCKHKKPQTQLHLEASQFISDYDGPHRENLLIVYYCGHAHLEDQDGVPGLHITGTQGTTISDKGFNALYEPSCGWEPVETHLEVASADILTIMNSVYTEADVVARGSNVGRLFETLAAGDAYAKRPDTSLFTRALIDSLKELHSQTTGATHRPFDTSRLHDRIMRRMRLQHHFIPPLITSVQEQNLRHICLAPLIKDVPLASPPTRARSILHLQIAFADNRKLHTNETLRLAGLLSDAAKRADLNITSLDWVAFETNVTRIRITAGIHRILKLWIRDFRSRKRAHDYTKKQSHPRYRDESDDVERLPKRMRVSSPTTARYYLTPTESVLRASPRVSPETALMREATSENIDFIVRLCSQQKGDTLICGLSWDLQSCMKTDLGGESTLGTFLTVTGDAFSAYATTCSEWVRRTWGDLGMSVLQTTCEALVHGTCESEHLLLRFNDHGDAVDFASAQIMYTDIEQAIDVVQTLTWLAATFRRPRGNSLHTSTASVALEEGSLYISLEPQVKVEGDLSTSCWHSLFGNTIITRGFYTGDHGGGLELPFDLMLELTGMLYTTAPSGPASPSGTFYTGVHSILYPTEKNETRGFVKWHYVASDYVMTPPADGTWLRLRQDGFIGMRTILGYTPSVQVHLGTESRLHQYESMTASHAGREKDSWSFSWDGLTVQAGFAGSGVSSPFKFARRTGQQGVPTAKPTYDQIIHGTSDKPVVLYDTAHAQESAWLVPQLSVILDLVLFQAHRERAWKDLSATARAALHAKPYWNGGLAAKEV
ncbi:serine/threonine protein kinase, partial [Venturia nashicola]